VIYAVVGGYVAAFAVIAGLVVALIKSMRSEGEAIAGRVEAGGRAERIADALRIAERQRDSFQRRNKVVEDELAEALEKWAPRTVSDARRMLRAQWQQAAGIAGGADDSRGADSVPAKPAAEARPGPAVD
jgi:F0F1-type ATP synthase membrane subunit b/b'